MDKQMKDTITEYIGLHRPIVQEYLQDMGWLESDGSVSKKEKHQTLLHAWFIESTANYEAAEPDNEYASTTEVTVEIGSHQSHSGLPILFDFDEAVMVPGVRS